ncbi:MAG: type IX secretion system plug protein domain-containing protein [Bacteroidales bacterium]
MKLVLMLLFTYSLALSAHCQSYFDGAYTLNNGVESIRCFRDGYELTNPVINLNSSEQLVFQFDKLGEQLSGLNYKIVHCNRNWEASNISYTDYIEGSDYNPIYNYEQSISTLTDYMHYEVFVPNDYVQIKLSGNYAFIVYQNDDPEDILFVKHFYVVDKRVSIVGNAEKARLSANAEQGQSLTMQIDYRHIASANPTSDFSVAVSQNGRPDTRQTDLKPSAFSNNVLRYDYNSDYVFKGCNEFRIFDIRMDNRKVGYKVETTGVKEGRYWAWLNIDKMRTYDDYFEIGDMNGRYTVENANRLKMDYDLYADYVLTKFSMHLPERIYGGDLFVYGALTNWQCTEMNKLQWNDEEQAYSCVLNLKEGVYNYMYAYIPKGSDKINTVSYEGSHWKTENEYMVMVYYKPIGARYDSLVGYQTINSKEKTLDY